MDMDFYSIDKKRNKNKQQRSKKCSLEKYFFYSKQVIYSKQQCIQIQTNKQ